MYLDFYTGYNRILCTYSLHFKQPLTIEVSLSITNNKFNNFQKVISHCTNEYSIKPPYYESIQNVVPVITVNNARSVCCLPVQDSL